MVVLSQPAALDQITLIKTCKAAAGTPPIITTGAFPGIPVIDLKDPEAKTQIVKACEEFGFFKLVNHDVPLELMSCLESHALNFFTLPQSDKDKTGPPDPFGYGSKRIGPNGDVGWVEYLLLNTNPQVTSLKSQSIFLQNPHDFRCAVEEYIEKVKSMSYGVLELMAEGLGMVIEQRDVLSKMLRDEKSDSCFRLNHYPPLINPTGGGGCEDFETFRTSYCGRLVNGGDGGGRNLIGFGEHTDPQIISVLRSNNTTGLQISLRDGTWVPVPPDHSSFFINVGDALQVMTNGRFKSVKHRVVADSMKSRISMIYFAGPPLSEKIAPLPCLMKEGEESSYKEFTWCEYKVSAYKSRLADYRLGPFEKNSPIQK